MKEILKRLINFETLTKIESKNILIDISKDKYNASEISSFLTIFMMRNITVEEIDGFREALIELCIKIDLSEHNFIDMCGTGGDNKNTFNISTISSFVVAGSGIKVAKHGNYGVSSKCGSSNVLEFLGLNFTNNNNILKKAIDKAGICILHAPLFHPAMKVVAPIRRDLGIKTFFNMLGPLVNPALPKNQVTGVFNLELMRLYNYVLQRTKIKYNIVYSLDSFDEISLTSEFKVMNNKSEKILSPSIFKLNNIKENKITGGQSIKSSAKIFMNVLNNNGTDEQVNVVCANSALAISLMKNFDLESSFEVAKESLKSGNALKTFNELKSILK
tara:strand:- start:99521 stop:100513 length:993 start_codon:yes stop_codon:yes gene_type:complete